MGFGGAQRLVGCPAPALSQVVIKPDSDANQLMQSCDIVIGSQLIREGILESPVK